jgi:hypothetical protein
VIEFLVPAAVWMTVGSICGSSVITKGMREVNNSNKCGMRDVQVKGEVRSLT